MLCFVALAVLAVMSVFSAKYRPLARRALDCVVKKALLRPCDTGLDEEIKAKSIAGIMRLSQPAAQFVNRHFEAFSLVMTVLFFASLIYTGLGIYNFAVYGNCNGPEGGFCIYNGLQNPAFLKAPTTLQGISAGNNSSNITVIEFGCYSCAYTAQAEESVRGLIDTYKDRVHFVFKPFPLPNHPYSMEAAIAASCAGDEGKYWEYRSALFERQPQVIERGEAELSAIASELSLTQFGQCYSSKKFQTFIETTLAEGQSCGIYGTPTFFVNGKPFVGPEKMAEVEAEVARLVSERGDG